MKKHGCLMTAFTILLVGVCLVIGWFYLSMNTLLLLPKGKCVGAYVSPDGERRVRVYVVSGNATVDMATRCEVVGNGILRHNIYWAYHAQNATVKWIDHRTVEINGIMIDIFREHYDYRKTVPE